MAVFSRGFGARRRETDPNLPPGQYLTEDFPVAQFDTRREGLRFVSMKPILEPHADKPLYFKRSHFHWTPLSHELSGKALANVFLEQGLLKE